MKSSRTSGTLAMAVFAAIAGSAAAAEDSGWYFGVNAVSKGENRRCKHHQRTAGSGIHIHVDQG